MIALILASLATFGIWESVNSVSPWSIPSWLHPAAVYGIALFFTWPDYRLAFAAMGVVAILHVVTTAVIPAPAPQLRGPLSQRPSRGSLPPLP